MDAQTRCTLPISTAHQGRRASAESSTSRVPMMNAIRHYVMVAHSGDLEPGTGKTVDANRMPLALFNVSGVYQRATVSWSVM